MGSFKKIDLAMQLLILLAALVTAVINADDIVNVLIYTSLVFYFGMGGWQLISTIVHWVSTRLVLLPKARRVYNILLLPALVICLFPIIKTPVLSGYTIFYAMIVGFAMAAFYFIITVIEYRKSKNMA